MQERRELLGGAEEWNELMEYEQRTEAQLAEIGLRRDGEAVTIDIPADANIFSMTLGRQLGPEGADRPAMLFERPGGRLETWSFAQWWSILITDMFSTVSMQPRITM